MHVKYEAGVTDIILIHSASEASQRSYKGDKEPVKAGVGIKDLLQGNIHTKPNSKCNKTIRDVYRECC